MKESATDHFIARRGNCAQAVALAWKDKKQPESDHHIRFSSSGGGRAPEGLCGALHAACELGGEKLTTMIQERFSQAAQGHITCREIRKNKIMPCAKCVETAAGILEKLTEEKFK